ncbi:MAG: tripartite tricarboxylate transporter substrate binding protein [Betaproteobacteria bacterium]|nr:tripartite tricarboxylate transporter substrate binding protein [Betaproteobacteria bacterium]
MIRREFFHAACVVALAAAIPASAFAQGDYPVKPIRLIVPFPPAGGTDVLSRVIGQAIGNATKWSIVIDNKPGAGGNIGLEMLAKSPADGYTIAMGQTANLAVNPALYSKMAFEPLKDFAPVAMVSSQPLILVVSENSKIRSLKDLVDTAKKNPGRINMASAGNGTIGHIGGELFQRRAGIKLTHVPYKGASPAVTDLMGGNVDCFFGNSQAVGGLVTGGKLRAIAVTSPQRIANFPNVPAVAESGYPGFEASTWSGLLAPAGTPQPVIDRLNGEVLKALKQPEVLKRLYEDGSTSLGGTPKQFAEFMRSEHAKWGAAVRDAGIKLD